LEPYEGARAELVVARSGRLMVMAITAKGARHALEASIRFSRWNHAVAIAAPPPERVVRRLEIEARVLDAAGTPFRSGIVGVIACPLEGWSVPCTNLLTGAADADGIVTMIVDPTVEYRFTGYVSNIGSPCPDWVSADGNEFHFSAELDAAGRELLQPTVFVVEEPPQSCPQPSI
jgi:hypothetical protein